jgi:prolyl-tRNA synthetase
MAVLTSQASDFPRWYQGFARLPWRACDEEGERTLNAAGISIRCVTTREGTVPDTLDAEDLVAIAARAY